MPSPQTRAGQNRASRHQSREVLANPEQSWPQVIASTCLGHLHLQPRSANTASTTPQRVPTLPQRETEAGELHNFSASPMSQQWSSCSLLAPVLGALGCSQRDPPRIPVGMQLSASLPAWLRSRATSASSGEHLTQRLLWEAPASAALKSALGFPGRDPS